eukprot:15467735-Alexandrium_andersonii.AAC.1
MVFRNLAAPPPPPPPLRLTPPPGVDCQTAPHPLPVVHLPAPWLRSGSILYITRNTTAKG